MCIKAVIIDDEKNIRQMLRSTLEKHFNTTVTVVGEAGDVNNAIATITALRPDLVFLDIHLKQGTGFDVLEQLEQYDFEVVFVTAHNHYAMQAFKCSAFGYLLKPFKVDDLRVVIDKLKDLQVLRNATSQRIKVLVENYGDEHGLMKRLIVSNVHGFDIIEITDIIRLESENNYTHFYLKNSKRITTSKTLKEYEELLGNLGFCRIHQRHIVNLRFVKTYHKGDGGSVVLINNEELPVSRNRKASFLKRFI